MKLKLNNHKVFFIGMAVIIFYMLLNRLQFYIGSETTKGTVEGFTKYKGRYPKYYPNIRFEADGVEYVVEGLKDMNVTYHDTVEMIYKPDDPTGAVVNTFYGFWFYPILFCLIPFMFWVSFVYAYITPKESLFIRVGKPDDEEESPGKFKYVRFNKGIEAKN
ncbi:MAG: DUF3592 domain-containing protein [Bacteroidota bacterium]